MITQNTAVPNTSQLIREIGEALFGSRWQTDMARQLGVSTRTVRRWVVGDWKPQPGIWDELATLLQQRGSAALRLSDHLKTNRRC